MSRPDLEFRKKCQLQHKKVKKLLKNGELDQAKELLDHIDLSISQWEDYIKSSRAKVNLLKWMRGDLMKINNRISYKIERRQRNKNDSE